MDMAKSLMSRVLSGSLTGAILHQLLFPNRHRSPPVDLDCTYSSGSSLEDPAEKLLEAVISPVHLLKDGESPTDPEDAL